jgi:Na+-transporting NADH:ubiquinone oxidoreductase subunit NqrC
MEVVTPPIEPEAASVKKSPDERKELLARLVTAQVADGARVESQSDYQAVLVRGHRLNNTLHLILTIVTAGLWGIVWLLLAIFTGEKRSVASVDEWGNSSIQRL